MTIGEGPPGGAALRLAIPAVATWSATLVALDTGRTAAWGIVTASTAVACLVVACRALGTPWGRSLLATAICVAAAGAGCGARMATIAAQPLHRLVARGAHVSVTATVTGQPSVRRVDCPVAASARASRCAPRVTIRADLRRVEVAGRPLTLRAPVLILARGAAAGRLGAGDRIAVAGTLRRPYPHELLAAVLLARGRPRVLAGPTGARGLSAAVRDRLGAAADVLPAPQDALLPGLVDGDTSRISEPVTDRFRATGLTHLLAASGANLAILLSTVLGITRAAGAGRFAGTVAGIPAIALFVLVCGPDPSVLRAAVMGLITLLALASGRQRSGIAALAGAALALLLADPQMARDYGFALSVLATGGILLLTPALRDRLGHRLRHGLGGRLCGRLGGRLPDRVAEALSVPLAAQLCCVPVLVMLSGRISLVAVPANLLADPAVAPATLLGALAAVLAFLPGGLAAVPVWCADLPVWWIATVARIGAALPGATVGWPAGITGAALCLVALATIIVLARRRRIAALACAAALAVTASVIWLHVVAPSWPPQRWAMVACDVGQGDGLVLNAGGGRAVVVDTGPSPDLMNACLRRVHVRRIPLLVLSHYHADHAGGVSGVLRGRTVGGALLDPDPVPRSSSTRVARLLAARRVHTWTAAPGMRWHVGRLRITVLGPSGDMVSVAAGESEGAGPDDASIPLLVRSGPVSMLLGADLMANSEAEMLRRSVVPTVDVLKVPHHGSANLDPDFFRRTGARAAIISVGAHNGYGHPAPRTLGVLRADGMRVYRTDQDGDIAVLATSPPSIETRSRPAGR